MAIGLIMAGVSIGSSIFSAIRASKEQKKAARKERRARREMNRLKQVYANMDITNPFSDLKNPYENMENMMEDLTINQQQAQFEAEQFQQSQANILSGLRGAAGGSGIAALAQTMAQQGQIAAQRSSASIGQQEAMNQRLQAQEASRIQTLQRQGQANIDQLGAQGEMIRQSRELERTGTMLGMSQRETAAYAQQKAAANEAKWSAISGAVKGAANMFAGFGGGERPLLSGLGGGSNRLGGYNAGESMSDYIQQGLRVGTTDQIQNQFENFDVFGGNRYDSSKYFSNPYG